MVELLLRKGGNPEVCGAMGCKPLLLALWARHEEIALFLFSNTSDPDSPIAGDAGYSSLHAACLRQLPKSARVFLECGADVNVRTSKGKKPLHLALEASDKANDNIRSCTLELVTLLLKFGSDRDTKAHSLSLQHADPRVRDLFREHKSLSLQKASFISVGRRWWVDGSSNAECVFSPMPASLSHSWNQQSADASGKEDLLTIVAGNMLDDKTFPMLDPSRPLREQQASSNAWDPSKVKKIRDTMLVIDSTEAEISTTGPPVEPFPKLIGRKSPHPLESAAQLSWKDLTNPKTQLVIDEACAKSKGKIPESRSQAGQASRKKRWHRLQLN